MVGLRGLPFSEICRHFRHLQSLRLGWVNLEGVSIQVVVVGLESIKGQHFEDKKGK